jgi:hypothetical protein
MISADVASRKFGVLDGMILIAATAGGLALWRFNLMDLLPSPPVGFLRADSFTRVRDGLTDSASFLAAATMAWLIMRLVPPRPGHLTDLPGMAAALAVIVVLSIESALTLVLIALGTRSNFTLTPLGYSMHTNPGYAVIGAWCHLYMSGRWAFERSWLDWLGFALGLCWIGVSIGHGLSFALMR